MAGYAIPSLVTVLEVTTLKKVSVRFSSAFVGAVAIASAFSATPAAAQRARAEQLAPRIMISTFQSSDKELGLLAAEAIRDRLARDVNPRNLFVIPKTDIYNTLQASGYTTTDALGPNDAKALANLLRADHYLEGSVVRTATGGVKVESRLVLARDNSLTQPLPSAEAGGVGQAASAISRSLQGALRQLDAEGKCLSSFRAQKYDEAIRNARAGLVGNPNATLIAICLGNAYYALNQQDSVLAIAERIRAVDPRSVPALRWAADIYGTRKDPREIDALTALLAADPTNLRLQQQVVNQLAASGQAARAVPIISEALRNNAGDPGLLRTAWLVLLAAREYNLAVQTGAELIKADTAAADTSYYIRLGSAYAALKQPQQAADALARGLNKFPNNSTMLVVQAQTLNNAGQFARAIQAARRALSINPGVEGGYALLATSYAGAGQPDSVIPVLMVASRAPNADRKLLAQIALKLGNDAYKAGNASKVRADFQRAVRLLQLSDQLDASATAKFLVGASAFSVGQSAVTEAQETKSCVLARLAKESFTLSQENVPAGLQEYPDAAKQLLTAIPQFMPAVNSQVQRFCR